MRCSFVLLAVALAGAASAIDTVNPDVSVTSWSRSLDLTSQLVKATHTVVYKNNAAGAVKSVIFTADPEDKGRVSYIGAEQENTYLRVSETKLQSPKDAVAYKIELKEALASGKEATLEIEVYLGKAVEMFPKEISQREKQLALFTGNHYVSSPYKVKTQTTKVQLPSTNIENYSKNLKPVSLTDTTITYGPYANIEPFAQELLNVHFENNNPFMIVSKLERVIELSMWGNIAVEETVDVRHAGASLKGSFSRYEFQRENSGVSSVKQFKTVLPASASDVYYRDDIGNISTSALRVMDDAVELELRPRFPLFGGWKTHYFIGYNVPSYEYLYAKGENLALEMRLVDHIFDDMLIEDFTLKIILPEGAQVGKLHTPYPMSRQADDLHFTYLDTSGRPVITIKNVNDLTEKHIEDFQLEFVYPRATMIREPLILIVAFFLFFLLTIVYVRLDFAIAKDEGSEVRMKVAGVCEKVLSHQDRRNNSYAAFEDAIAKFKASKDNAAFAAAQKKIAADLKGETQSISDLIPALKAIQGEVAEKVNEVQKYDRNLREQQANQVLLVEKLVSQKLARPQFIEAESQVTKKKDECREKIAALSGQLRAF